MKYIKQCKLCGKEFTAHRRDAVFCSKKCKDDSRYILHDKVCIVCGRHFKTRKSQKQICSEECAKKRDQSRLRSYHTKRTWDEYVSFLQSEAIQRAKEREDAKLRYKEEHTIERECEECGSLFFCLDTENRVTCSSLCSKRRHNRRCGDKRIPKAQRVDKILLPRLYERDDGICYLCGGKCDFDDWRENSFGARYPGDLYPTIEHVVPVSMGGLDSWQNVRLAHWACNCKKGATVPNDIYIGNFITPAPKSGPKKTAQYSKDGELIKIWESTARIKRETGFNDTYIQNVCRGRGKTAYGYVWRYVS